MQPDEKKRQIQASDRSSDSTGDNPKFVMGFVNGVIS
jgi:hypothetical protein